LISVLSTLKGCLHKYLVIINIFQLRFLTQNLKKITSLLALLMAKEAFNRRHQGRSSVREINRKGDVASQSPKKN